MIIIPDTNRWQGNISIDELREDQDRGTIRIGCTPEILEEVLTRKLPRDARATCARILRAQPTWLVDRKAAANLLYTHALSDSSVEPDFQLDISQSKDILKILERAQSESDSFFAELRPLRVTEKQRRTVLADKTRLKFGKNFRELNPDVKLPLSDFEDRYDAVRPLLEKYLDLNDPDCGLFLDNFLRSLGVPACAIGDTPRIVSQFSKIPGLKLFYCHSMINYLTEAFGYRVDRSFSLDAQLLLVGSPTRIFLTSDKALLHTNNYFFENAPIVMEGIPNVFEKAA